MLASTETVFQYFAFLDLSLHQPKHKREKVIRWCRPEFAFGHANRFPAFCDYGNPGSRISCFFINANGPCEVGCEVRGRMAGV